MCKKSFFLIALALVVGISAGVANADLKQLVLQWLSEVPNVEVDLYGDDYIDFKDFVVLAGHWLQSID